MTEREALLRAVCDSPTDDTPRLIYADWLEENGDPERAEFIRLQCENIRFRRPAQMTAQEYLKFNKLIVRDLDLEHLHGHRWRAELLHKPGMVWGGYRRGFVNSLQVRMWADGVTVPDLEVIAVTVPLERLDLSGRFEPEEITGLTAVRRLEGLILRGMMWTADGWQRFGAWRTSVPNCTIAVEVDRSSMPRTLRRWLKDECKISLFYPPR